MNKKQYFFECIDGLGLDEIHSGAIKKLFHQCFEANEAPDKIIATYGEVPPSDGSPYVDENGHFVAPNGWLSEDIKQYDPKNMKSKLARRMFGGKNVKVAAPSEEDMRSMSNIAGNVEQGNYSGAEAIAKRDIQRKKIRSMQHMLNQKYGFGLKEDGIWGPKTANAWRYHTKGPQNAVTVDKNPNFDGAHDQHVAAGANAGYNSSNASIAAQSAYGAGHRAVAQANADAFNKGELPVKGQRSVKPNELNDIELAELEQDKKTRAALKGTMVGRPEYYDDDPSNQPGNYDYTTGY